jgi:hypothetical protein
MVATGRLRDMVFAGFVCSEVLAAMRQFSHLDGRGAGGVVTVIVPSAAAGGASSGGASAAAANGGGVDAVPAIDPSTSPSSPRQADISAAAGDARAAVLTEQAAQVLVSMFEKEGDADGDVDGDVDVSGDPDSVAAAAVLASTPSRKRGAAARGSSAAKRHRGMGQDVVSSLSDDGELSIGSPAPSSLSLTRCGCQFLSHTPAQTHTIALLLLSFSATFSCTGVPRHPQLSHSVTHCLLLSVQCLKPPPRTATPYLVS